MAARELAHRVDALVCAWKLEPTAATLQALDRCHDDSRGAGRVAVELGGVQWSVRPSRQQSRYLLERGPVRGCIDLREEWNCELIARSTYLATTPLPVAVTELQTMAGEIGNVLGTRLRRFDLAADFAGWPLRQTDVTRLVKTRCRTARVASFRPDVIADGEQVRSRTYRAAAELITGHVVAPGNPLMLRCYDKVAELKIGQNAAKREIEHSVWKQAGWDGDQGVTRIEFQLRGQVLDELKLRNPQRLGESLQPVWNALVGVGTAVDRTDPRSGWIRLRGVKRPIDPRWRRLRELDWTGPQYVAPRVRLRNAVPLRAALGNVLSYLGGQGVLEQALAELPDVDPHQLDAAPAAVRERVIRDVLAAIAGTFAECAARELREDFNGATYAVCRPLEVAARFDETPVEPDKRTC